MDNIYFCEAFIRSVGAIGSNGKIYVLYEPEEDLGEIMLDWLSARGVPNGKSVGYRSAEAAAVAVRGFCERAHGGHSSPPSQRMVPFTPGFHLFILQSVKKGAYGGPPLPELYSRYLRTLPRTITAAPSSTRAATSARAPSHSQSAATAPALSRSQSAAMAPAPSRSRSAATAPILSPSRSAAMPIVPSPSQSAATAPTRLQEPSVRHQHSSSARHQSSSQRAPTSESHRRRQPSAQVTTPVAASPSSAASPAPSTASPRHPAPPAPTSTSALDRTVAQRVRRIRDITRALALQEMVRNWSIDAANALQYGSDAGSVGTVDEDGPVFIVTADSLIAPVIFSTWKQACDYRQHLLKEGAEDALVNAAANKEERETLLSVLSARRRSH